MATQTAKTSIFDASTGEVIERELTADEIALYEADQEFFAEKEAAKHDLQIKKEEVVAKLGLTAEEVAALLS
jgi:hypothetical protein